MHPYRVNRIIATVGPSTSTVEELRRLIRAGADCFRLNFSHGDGVAMTPYMEAIRKAEELEGAYISILADIQGPRIRIGELPRNGVVLTEGESFVITTRSVEGSEKEVGTTYKRLPQDVLSGARILLADGTIELKAESITETDVVCRIVIGGRLFSHRGINLPHTRLSVETLTEKDERDLRFIAESDINMVAISFVRSAQDILRAKSILGRRDIPVIAKLEVPEAVDKLGEILDAADGVMVARGDLGVELDFEEVPIVQKRILEKATLRGKWSVVATQMLVSMVTNSRPTRAEVTDVANAVMEGADAVMLSEETATGQHPEDVVRAMSRIIDRAAEFTPPPSAGFESDIVSFPAAAAGAAVNAAERLKAAAIVALAGSGSTAMLLSKWRPSIPILALSANIGTMRRLNVLRGVVPVKLDVIMDIEGQLEVADRYMLKHGLARPGDPIIMVGALPSGAGKDTNTIRFHRVRGYDA